MDKSESTLVALETALERIVQGNPRRIRTGRKLSVSAVEEEAGLGDGSAYYKEYSDFVKKVKQTKIDIAQAKGEKIQPEIESVRTKLNEQKRIKSNFKDKYKAEKEKLANFAAVQHHLNDKLVQALARIDDLEFENANLKEENANLRRSKIVPIK